MFGGQRELVFWVLPEYCFLLCLSGSGEGAEGKAERAAFRKIHVEEVSQRGCPTGRDGPKTRDRSMEMDGGLQLYGCL